MGERHGSCLWTSITLSGRLLRATFSPSSLLGLYFAKAVMPKKLERLGSRTCLGWLEGFLPLSGNHI